MDGTRKCHTAARSIVAKENVNFPMFKLLIASGVAARQAVLASPAQADWYVNPG